MLLTIGALVSGPYRALPYRDSGPPDVVWGGSTLISSTTWGTNASQRHVCPHDPCRCEAGVMSTRRDGLLRMSRSGRGPSPRPAPNRNRGTAQVFSRAVPSEWPCEPAAIVGPVESVRTTATATDPSIPRRMNFFMSTDPSPGDIRVLLGLFDALEYAEFDGQDSLSGADDGGRVWCGGDGGGH